jgi:hypothetical protein
MSTIEIAPDLEPDAELTVDSPAGAALVATVAPWWTKARCNDNNGTLSHLFFSEELHDIARAKAICARCPVADQCLDEAVDRAEPWGVWGGQLLVNGRIVAHKRPRGRPPRNPRAELVVDEVPLPPGYREAKTA